MSCTEHSDGWCRPIAPLLGHAPMAPPTELVGDQRHQCGAGIGGG
jgi:hypothetical protein